MFLESIKSKIGDILEVNKAFFFQSFMFLFEVGNMISDCHHQKSVVILKQMSSYQKKA